MESTCNICTITQQEANLLATDYWIVNLSYDQGYLGRAYVTLREHKGHLSDLSEAEWKDYTRIVKLLENACKQGLGATLFNWSCLMNNAYQEQPAKPHVHWHFRPRYKQAATVGNVTFEDPEFGYHYDRQQKRTVDEQTFQTIIKDIKAYL